MLNAFETDRLYLRPFERGDLADLFGLYASASVMHYITATRTREETEIRLRKHMEDRARHGFGLFATILKANGAFVGRCGLDPVVIDGRLEGDIAWMFAPTYWNRGFATEFGHRMLEIGFRDLGLPRIFATAHRENVASIRVMEKLDMDYVAMQGQRVEYERLRSSLA